MSTRVTIASSRPLTGGPGVDLRAAWSPDGRSIVFERQQGGRSSLIRVGARAYPGPRSGGEDLDPLDVCPGAETVQGRPAFFGPDDVVVPAGRGRHLALWRVRGGVAERLTDPEGASDYGPAPMADGGVVFFRMAPEEPPRLLRLGPDGCLHALGEEGDQPWPMGGDLVFHSDRDGTDAVWRLDADGGGAVRVTPAGLDEGTPYVTPMPSPDGGWIAFARGDGADDGAADGGESQIWLMRPDGGDRQRLTDGEPHSFPAWSPDGEALVATRGRPTSDDNPTGDLWRLTLSFS